MDGDTAHPWRRSQLRGGHAGTSRASLHTTDFGSLTGFPPHFGIAMRLQYLFPDLADIEYLYVLPPSVTLYSPIRGIRVVWLKRYN